MALYRCSLFNGSGAQPGMTPLLAASDAEARQLALELLRQSPEVDRVEVWRDADLAFRLNQRQARLETNGSPRGH
jgi:hypothetical protein